MSAAAALVILLAVPTAVLGAQTAKSVRIPILVYHSVRPYYNGETPIQKAYDVTPAVFESQMSYLSAYGYTPLSLDEVALANSTSTKLPPKPVAITFDDGWENQYQYALPILLKYRLAATFYVITSRIGHLRLMNWLELRDLANKGMTIGSHSVNHLDLKRVTDDSLAWHEIADSRRILQERLNRPVTAFAYPGGTYTPRDLQYVQAAGYRTARSVGGTSVVRSNALYHLPGFIVRNDMASFIARLTN
jgi:peptidoglycan/xylan/chitin deacetylase (PgdA/CDA1 family)